MQHVIAGSTATSISFPTVVLKGLDDERMAIRFRRIGNYQRFSMVLQHFRFEFLTAICEEIEGQAWWIIASGQRAQLVEFARRNGLKLAEE